LRGYQARTNGSIDSYLYIAGVHIVMGLSHLLAGQKILVTGASGFIGSHLCCRLGQSGVEVHAISRTKRSSDTSYLHWWQGDLGDITIVQNLLNIIKPDVVFHLSGQVTAAPSQELVLTTLYSLLVSTVNLLTVASKIGCSRIVLTGSLTEPEPGHTDAPPGSPYAAAKWASSAYGRMFHELYQAPVVIARPFMTYGPGQDISKLIPHILLLLLQGEAPKLSSGQWQADWIYIDDVVDGLLAAAQAPGVEGSTVDLGSGALVSIRAVVQQIVNLVGSRAEPVFGALPDRPLEQVRVADTARSYATMGWEPTTPLTEGLKRTLAWYERQLKMGTLT
jgi:nucleoside-diphosphate-sugar epimerase